MSTQISAAMSLPAMTSEAIDKVVALESELFTRDQIGLGTRHYFHAGIYARSIVLPKDAVLTGALIKIPTMLIVSGSVLVYNGENVMSVTGLHIVEAQAWRKQVFVGLENTSIVMMFATKAETVDAAEREFTDEFEKLLSRRML